MTRPASRSAVHAPAAGVAVERARLTGTQVGQPRSPSIPLSANGKRPARQGAVAGRNPPATTPPPTGAPPSPVGDLRTCRVCGRPVEPGRYLVLRHVNRRPRGAVAHYPR